MTSLAQSSSTPLDFILYCCVCFLPLSSAKPDTGEPPFWLTSCGHITCSSHVFPSDVPTDASTKTHNCPYCENRDVSLAAVTGKEPPAGLRDYFTPQTELVENLQGALKFQHDNLVRIATHYKELSDRLSGKLENQKRVLIRVKDELLEAREIKKEKPIMEAELAKLRQENDQLRAQQSGAHALVSDQRQQQQPQRTSSSRAMLQMSSSPFSAILDEPNPLKRNIDSLQQDEEARARDFRRELNARAMPPPPRPRSSPAPPSSQAHMQPSRTEMQPQSEFDQQQQYFNSYQQPLQSNGYHQQPFDRNDDDNLYAPPPILQTFTRQSLPVPPAETYFPPRSAQHHPSGSSSRAIFLQRQSDMPPPRTPSVNQPFRSPFRRDTPALNSTSYFSPLSRNGQSHSLSKYQYQPSSPLQGKGQDRISLAPPPSHSKAPFQFSRPGEAQATTATTTTTSPFFKRPYSSVLGNRPWESAFGRDHMGTGVRAATGVGAGRGVGGGLEARRPETLPSRSKIGGGGLGELLGGGLQRAGGKRAVRR